MTDPSSVASAKEDSCQFVQLVSFPFSRSLRSFAAIHSVCPLSNLSVLVPFFRPFFNHFPQCFPVFPRAEKNFPPRFSTPSPTPAPINLYHPSRDTCTSKTKLFLGQSALSPDVTP